MKEQKVYKSKKTDLSPWLVLLQHKDTLQRVRLLAFGSTPDRAKAHSLRPCPQPADWSIVDCMAVTSSKFVTTAFFVFPEKYNSLCV